MGKKVALIFLTLVLVLTGLMPATVAAAKPNDVVAAGVLLDIDEGTVNAAGNSGRFRVEDRTILGLIATGALASQDPFALTYHANVVLLTQAGNFQGRMTTGRGVVLNVNGKTEAAVGPIGYIPNTDPDTKPLFLIVPVYTIEISGKWAVLNGGTGNGDFAATLAFVPTLDGHIAAVVPLYDGVIFDIDSSGKPVPRVGVISSPVVLTGKLGK